MILTPMGTKARVAGFRLEFLHFGCGFAAPAPSQPISRSTVRPFTGNLACHYAPSSLRRGRISYTGHL